jgi:hypothetical protein
MVPHSPSKYGSIQHIQTFHPIQFNTALIFQLKQGYILRHMNRSSLNRCKKAAKTAAAKVGIFMVIIKSSDPSGQAFLI